MENLNKQLIKYVELIRKLELVLLENHGFGKEPMFKNAGKIPREGIIKCNNQKVTYKIHGGGCTYEYSNGLILDYDFVSRIGTTINFSPWKFSRFLNTTQTEKEYSQEELVPHLEKMLQEGFLVKNPDGFYFYGVDEDFLKN